MLAVSSTGVGQDRQAPTPAVSPETLALYAPGEFKGVKYRLMKPIDFDENKSYPLILSLHGAGGRNQQFVRSLQDQVDAGRMIGVYPQGHNMGWNLGGRESTADDVAFLEGGRDELRRYANLDHDRRFVFGTSNGAGMAHRLAVESRGFKAIATVVTQLTRGNEPTANSETVGVLQVLGVDDRLIPYQGGSGPMGLDFYPGEESARLW